MISPGFGVGGGGLCLSKRLFLVGLFAEGLVIGGNSLLQSRFGLIIKTALNTMIKQLILIVHGLIFGRAYYQKDICV